MYCGFIHSQYCWLWYMASYALFSYPLLPQLTIRWCVYSWNILFLWDIAYSYLITLCSAVVYSSKIKFKLCKNICLQLVLVTCSMVYNCLVIVAFFGLLVIKKKGYIFVYVMIPSASPLMFFCYINNDKILIFFGYLVWEIWEML